MIEHEVKLACDSLEAARRSIQSAGGRLVVSRRLIDDQLFDTESRQLLQAGATLRIRRAGDQGVITFKGPIQPSPVKSREEIETTVGDAAVAEAIVRSLGFRAFFRAQKYREEYSLGAGHVIIDDTPIGVYIEIEALPADVESIARQLGRSRADFILDSYPRLYLQWCERRGVAPGNMMF